MIQNLPGEPRVLRAGFSRFLSLQKSLCSNISSAYSRRKYFFLAISFLACFSFACKNPDEIGADVIPAGSQLNLILSDTSTVVSQTALEDSVRGDELSLSLLGSYNDPVFGNSTASVYAQVYLSGTPDFGTVTQSDSFVLSLSYSGYYGDTLSSQIVNVYRLSDDMYLDSSYYTFKTFADNGIPIGSMTYQPHPNQNVVVDTTAESPQLRIRLDQTLADQLMALNGHAEFSTNDLWIAYFKGLRIQATRLGLPDTGSISYFNFYNSKLTMYYHDTSNTIKTYNFSLSGARVNHFDHDYTGTAVGMQLTDPTSGDSINYLQAMCGVKTKITFPYFKNYLDSGKIVINRSEVKIRIQSGSGSSFAPALNVFLLAIDSLGHVYFPADYYESGSAYGGTVGSDGVTYTFNIARQLQRVLNGTVKDYGYYLVTSGSSVEANRTIIGSGKNATYPIRLQLYYTKLH